MTQIKKHQMCRRRASKSRKPNRTNIAGLIKFFAAMTVTCLSVPSFAQNSDNKEIMASANLTPAAKNRKPIARVDLIDLKLASTAVNVLANDLDADGDRLVMIKATAQFGAVAFTPDGLLAYAQEADQSRADRIDYVVSDNRGGFDTGVVNIHIQ